MITIQKITNTRIMPNEERVLGQFAGLSTDNKPTEWSNKSVDNGSVFLEIDTGKEYMFDYENQKWYEKKNSGGSGADIEPSKSVEYTSNGDYTISPSSGYDGIEGASVSVNVPSSVNNETQSVSITSNGETTYTPSSGYTGIGSITVDVNVSGGGSSGIDLTSGVRFAKSQFYSVPNDILGCNWENLESAEGMFAENYNLTSFPGINTSSYLYSVARMFNADYALTSISLFNTSSVNYFDEFCRSCGELEDLPAFNTSSAHTMTNMVDYCPDLTNTSLNNVLAMCIQASSTLTSPKTFADIGLSKSQVAICETLPNYQDAITAGWVSGYEVTIDVDLAAIRNLAGTGTDYIVPQYDVLDGFIQKYGIELTLNDSTLQEQVVGEITWQDFASSDGTLSFYIDYTSVTVDDEQHNEYHFSNIQYNPQQ